MTEEKKDRRIRKTKKTLVEALITMMAEKRTSSITVRELTRLADVNRSTFYLYYKDVFDMVEKVEDELLDDFEKQLHKCFTGTTTHKDLQHFFTYMFEFVQTNARIARILLGPDGEYSFLEKLKAILKWPTEYGNQELGIKLKYYDPFLMSGSIGVIQKWLEGDMKESPDEMGAMLMDLVCGDLLLMDWCKL